VATENTAKNENIQIVPIAEEHIEGFRQCLDTAARERRT
jgi:hypothetical protein